MAEEDTKAPEPTKDLFVHARALPNPNAGVTSAANPNTELPVTTALGLEMAITVAALYNAEQQPEPPPEAKGDNGG